MKVGRKHGIHQIKKFWAIICVLLCYYTIKYYWSAQSVLLFSNLNNVSVTKSMPVCSHWHQELREDVCHVALGLGSLGQQAHWNHWLRDTTGFHSHLPGKA